MEVCISHNSISESGLYTEMLLLLAHPCDITSDCYSHYIDFPTIDVGICGRMIRRVLN